MPAQHEPLKSVLGRTQRSIESARERHAKRVCHEITRRLEELQQSFPTLWYCDGMGTCALWSTPKREPRATYTDPLYLAFDHVLYNWTDENRPLIDAEDGDDETPQRIAAAKIVRAHGVTLFEIVQAGRFLDEHCRSCYGVFPEDPQPKDGR